MLCHFAVRLESQDTHHTLFNKKMKMHFSSSRGPSSSYSCISWIWFSECQDREPLEHHIPLSFRWCSSFYFGKNCSQKHIWSWDASSPPLLQMISSSRASCMWYFISVKRTTWLCVTFLTLLYNTDQSEWKSPSKSFTSLVCLFSCW